MSEEFRALVMSLIMHTRTHARVRALRDAKAQTQRRNLPSHGFRGEMPSLLSDNLTSHSPASLQLVTACRTSSASPLLDKTSMTYSALSAKFSDLTQNI